MMSRLVAKRGGACRSRGKRPNEFVIPKQAKNDNPQNQGIVLFKHPHVLPLRVRHGDPMSRALLWSGGARVQADLRSSLSRHRSCFLSDAGFHFSALGKIMSRRSVAPSRFLGESI